jgi:hypothetical protein
MGMLLALGAAWFVVLLSGFAFFAGMGVHRARRESASYAPVGGKGPVPAVDLRDAA